MNFCIYTGKENEWLSTSAVTGLVAGGCAKMCVYPLDVLKKRLQIRGFEEAREQFGKVSLFFPYCIFLYLTLSVHEINFL